MGQYTREKLQTRMEVTPRLDKDSNQGKTEFLTELEILLEYKHENIIGLIGYCNEMGESIIIYEYASRGSLDKYVRRDDGLNYLDETTSDMH